PELGQMLATARESLRDPWGMVTVGGVIFLAVLGFNLIGQGMQQRLELDRSRRGRRVEALALELETRVSDTLQPWLRRRGITPRRILGGLGVAAGVTLLALGAGRSSDQAGPAITALVGNPGGHLWAAERYNAQGTLWSDVSGPVAPIGDLVFMAEDGIVGGPSVAVDGSLYLNLARGSLIALGPDGEALWEAELEAAPVGAPALGEDGTVYVAGTDGGLSAFGPEGNLRWRHEIQGYGEATGGPVVGPGGAIVYTLDNSIQSVSPAGEPLWRAATESLYVYASPRLSADWEWVYLKSEAFRAQNGEPVDLRPAPAQGSLFQDPRFFVGADGIDYYLLGNSVLAWEASQAGVDVIRQAVWNSAGFVVNFPADAGVLPDGSIWLLYAGQFGDTRLVWLSPEGSTEAISFDPFRLSRVLGLDQESNLFWCGVSSHVACLAYPARSATPLWQVELESGLVPVGGALAPGRAYVAMEGGSLYVLRDRP
ncbi:MAG: PQQ-binding-like beta-propeller repeat protein, partial [Anaerolineales bacterium]